MKQSHAGQGPGMALIWILLYLVFGSLGGLLSRQLGLPLAGQAGLYLLLILVLLLQIRRRGLWESCGLCRPAVSAGRLLLWLPLAVLSSSNLWLGVTVPRSPVGMVFPVLAMMGVGILEELLFRGLLFRGLEARWGEAALWISGLSFGLFHLITLINGSGQTPASILWLVLSASAVGFLYGVLLSRSGSLIPGILSHMAIDVFSLFLREQAWTPGRQALISLVTAGLALGYGLYLTKALPAVRPPFEKEEAL